MSHTIDHLGIAVKSLEQARKFYEQLGLTVAREEVVPHEKVKVAMIALGESRIELLEATSSDSVTVPETTIVGTSRCRWRR